MTKKVQIYEKMSESTKNCANLQKSLGFTSMFFTKKVKALASLQCSKKVKALASLQRFFTKKIPLYGKGCDLFLSAISFFTAQCTALHKRLLMLKPLSSRASKIRY